MEAKTFTADTIQHLEQQLNAFLDKNRGIEIHSTAQSESGKVGDWSITFTIIYEKDLVD